MLRSSRNHLVALVVTLMSMILVASACASSESGSSSDSGSSATGATTTDSTSGSYPIVGTGQTQCYNDSVEIACPAEGEAFFGQDGNELINATSYTDNGDGTVTDDVTGLMWQQDPGEKTAYDAAVAAADSFTLAGHDDWRLPTIKELYSLILFSGTDTSPESGDDTSVLTPFIDTELFVFSYGDTSAGDRVIDSQWTTATVYESTVFSGEECFFGVNFADGRIKCYPTTGQQEWYTRYVRDADDYGENSFVDNGDGTVTDSATTLTWQQADSAEGMNWEAALSYCDGLEIGDEQDWRLASAKELQSIVDYSRSPDTTSSAAIDSVFEVTAITNEGGEEDFPAFWTATTHVAYPDNGSQAAYIAFGRALGYQNDAWIDVHGAGAQRSDPKIGDASEWPTGFGPQGDAIRIDNYVRCVRGG